MPTTCVISFDNPDAVYYAGQLLSGTVNLTLANEKKVRGIFVNIFGKAYAYWTEHCSIDHNPRRDERGNRISSSGHTVSYVGEEDYLNERTYFVGGRDADSFQLAPGTYNYTFQCLLPEGLPTSVQHGVGHISYGANVVLDIPFWTDKEFQSHFTVIKRIDLNYMPLLRTPATGVNEQSFYPLGICCCCPNGPLILEVYAPVRGYAPGQTINIKVNVHNGSSSTVSELEVQLNKQITFHGRAREMHHSDSSTKIVNETITTKMIKTCNAKTDNTEYVNLTVPSIPPTDFSTSNVVKFNYTIRVAGSVDSCCNSVIPLDVGITIGTIPIQDNFDTSNMNAGVVISGQPTFGSNGTFPNAPTAPYPSVPTAPIATDFPNAPIAPSAPIDFNDNPPSYEEAMNMGGESSTNHKPKYPMFRRQTSYSIDIN